jgi:hypothetical protein
MNVFASKALELNVEANRAGGNPRQHSSRLARGAEWFQDGHDAIAFGSGGSVTEISVTSRYRRRRRCSQYGTLRIPTLVKIDHFREINVLVEAKS